MVANNPVPKAAMAKNDSNELPEIPYRIRMREKTQNGPASHTVTLSGSCHTERLE